jgi:hypothetical protein
MLMSLMSEGELWTNSATGRGLIALNLISGSFLQVLCRSEIMQFYSNDLLLTFTVSWSAIDLCLRELQGLK